MGEHARLMPSKAYQWVNCPASVTLQERYPETDRSESAEEGTAAHEVAAKVLGDFLYYGRKGHSFKAEDFIDTVATNGVVISEEMVEAVEMYVHDVMQVSRRYDGMSDVFLEHRVHIPWVHADNWGTLDNAVTFYGAQSDTLVISDFKYGRGIVEAEGNEQLLNYAMGLIAELIERNKPVPRLIELRVVQPRPYHSAGRVRPWTLPVSELGPYVEKFRDSAAEAFGPAPRAKPGKHCTYCSARHTCTALRNSNYAAIDYVMAASPEELRGADLGQHITVLRHISELVKAQLSGFELQGLAELEAGRKVDGWAWERSTGKKKWCKPLEEVHVLGDLMGVELRKPGAITPLQAISAGMPSSLVDSYSETTSGKVNLVPESTKRSKVIFKQS